MFFAPFEVSRAVDGGHRGAGWGRSVCAEIRAGGLRLSMLLETARMVHKALMLSKSREDYCIARLKMRSCLLVGEGKGPTPSAKHLSGRLGDRPKVPPEQGTGGFRGAKLGS